MTEQKECREALHQAVANLIKVKGRHNTEVAYQRLVEAFDALSAAPKAQQPALQFPEKPSDELSMQMLRSMEIAKAINRGGVPPIDFDAQQEQPADTQETAEMKRSMLAAANRTDEKYLLVQKMVDRFLAWPLPKTVRPDGCASDPDYPHRSGTHLLTANEAKAMFLHCLEIDAQQEQPAKCPECYGHGTTDNHVTGEVECGTCEGTGEAPQEQPAPQPIGYLPKHEIGRLHSGHDANLRSAKFGPSNLDGDIAVYIAPTFADAQPAQKTCAKQMREAGKPSPRTCPTCGLGPCSIAQQEQPADPQPSREAFENWLIGQFGDCARQYEEPMWIAWQAAIDAQQEQPPCTNEFVAPGCELFTNENGQAVDGSPVVNVTATVQREGVQDNTGNAQQAQPAKGK